MRFQDTHVPCRNINASIAPDANPGSSTASLVTPWLLPHAAKTCCCCCCCCCCCSPPSSAPKAAAAAGCQRYTLPVRVAVRNQAPQGPITQLNASLFGVAARHSWRRASHSRVLPSRHSASSRWGAVGQLLSSTGSESWPMFWGGKAVVFSKERVV